MFVGEDAFAWSPICLLPEPLDCGGTNAVRSRQRNRRKAIAEQLTQPACRQELTNFPLERASWIAFSDGKDPKLLYITPGKGEPTSEADFMNTVLEPHPIQ